MLKTLVLSAKVAGAVAFNGRLPYRGQKRCQHGNNNLCTKRCDAIGAFPLENLGNQTC